MKTYLSENKRVAETLERIEAVRVGKIITVDESGQAFVDFPGNTQWPISARFTNSVNLKMLRHAASADQDVLLVFENNDPGLPIIIDILYSLVDEITESPPMELQVDESKDVTVDGKRITFDAREQIELRCGKASIILTQAGKIIIRGAYLLNRSSGVNRIKGGSVQIN